MAKTLYLKPDKPEPVRAPIEEIAGNYYSSNEKFMLNDLKTLVNQLREALVKNGVVI